MPFDPNTLGREARDRYIEVGEQFGSGDVLRQLDVSILGAEKSGEIFAQHGWPVALTDKAKEIRDALIAAGVQRAAARVGKKTTNAALLDARTVAKSARQSARTGLATARVLALEANDLALVSQIDATLASTAGSADDAKLLGEQLKSLADLLATEGVASKLGAMAAELTTSLTTARDALDIARKAKGNPHGTPAETDLVNLLDGIGATYARLIRKAGRAAARATGKREYADAVELSELYSSTGRKKGSETEGPPTTTPGGTNA